MLTTYSTLHGHLGRSVGQEITPLEQYVVLVEHEIGVSIESIVTGDMLGMVAKSVSEQDETKCIKLLGLSYSLTAGNWLQHPSKLMGNPKGELSLDMTVSAENHARLDRLDKMMWNDGDIRTCATEAAKILDTGLNVVVFSGEEEFGRLHRAARELAPSGFAVLDEAFMDWPRVSLTDEIAQVFRPADGVDNIKGHLICVPHDGFPCPLPFQRIGMVVLARPGDKVAYVEEERLCLGCSVSLTQDQYRMESMLRTPGQEPPLVRCFLGNTDNLPSQACHLVNREDSYLGGWLSVIHAFPGRAISELPFLAALPWPAYSHDCLVQLGVMGLVETGKDMARFKLTSKGISVMHFYELLRDLDLCTLSALVDAQSLEKVNVRRSAIRLVLLLEYYRMVVKEVVEQENCSAEGFFAALKDVVNASRNGGPGRELIDRGALWFAWVALEEAARGLDGSSDKDEAHFVDEEIIPKTARPPLVLRASGVCDYIMEVAFWKKTLGLESLPKGDWGGFRLSKSEADMIQNLMAKSWYPFLIEIPLQFRYIHGQGIPVDSGMYRSKSVVVCLKHTQALFKNLWVENARRNAPSRSSVLCAGLPAPPLNLGRNKTQVIADPVMIMPWTTVSSLAQNRLDKWARDNSGLNST